MKHPLDHETQNVSTEVRLRCPECHGSLEQSGSDLLCDSCDRRYPVLGRMPMLHVSPPPCHGQGLSNDMVGLPGMLADASQDAESALHRWFRWTGRTVEQARQMLASGNAGWKFLLPLARQATVLDLGCGWGAATLGLASHFGHVVAMDQEPDPMWLGRLRAEVAMLANVQFVCGYDGKYLPFDDRCFDVVVLNRALARAALQRRGNPRAVQLALLRETRRVLREDGVLLLLENHRFAWKQWFRQADDDTGLRLVTWMPRAAANAYSRLRGHGAYRTYLYGARGYQALLREAGFGVVAVHTVFSSHGVPDAIWPEQRRPRPIARSFRRVTTSPWTRARQQVRGWLNSRFPEAYAIRATPGGSLPTFVDRLCRELQEKAPGCLPEMARLASYRINSDMGMVTIVMRPTRADAEGFIIRLSLHERGEQHLRRESQLLQAVRDDAHPLASQASLLPRCLYQGVLEGVYAGVFSLLPGVSVDEPLWTASSLSRALDEVARFGIEMHRASARPWVGSQMTRRLVDDKAKRLVSLALHTQARVALERLSDALERRMEAMKLPVVQGHGDFKLRNALFDPKQKNLRGVIDWGAAESQELALYDLSFLLVDYLMLRDGSPLVRILGAWLARGRLDPWANAWMQDCARQLDLDWNDETSRLLAQYQWLQRMAPLATGNEVLRFHHGYLDAMFSILSNGLG